MGILYFFIAIFATSIGAATGMGGGVIIKPVLDALGHFPVEDINVLSSLSVFTMSIVSILRGAKNMAALPEFNLKTIVPLALGSVLGGLIGGGLFSLIAGNADDYLVTVVQNVILLIVIAVIFVYMLNKDKVKPLNLQGIAPSVLTGLGLGIISTFLGIGGGPINVVAIILVFGYSTKLAGFSSIINIFFAQISKTASIMFGSGFGAYDLSVLPFMLVGAVSGSLIGSQIVRIFSDKQIDRFFNTAQVLIMGLCCFNILRALQII